MLAMAVFSLVLVAAAAGLIQVGRVYYKSVITTRTQDTARAVIDEVSRSIQFSGDEPRIVTDAEGNSTVCTGGNRYTANVGQQAGEGSDPALFKDDSPLGCDNSVSLASDGIELLGNNMSITRFEVLPITGSVDRYEVFVWIAYGDDDVLETDPNDSTRRICRTVSLGGEFCAISELSTVVSRRIL